ncbi:MAG: DUF1566 domain-containing protein, partial [Candidatus Auribacterota bacterium]|nr:DUF1566 domain-containing protein [Candidatus Auribacterota bacterium]
GGTGDIPVPGDYSGDRSDREAIFRPLSGLWAVRGLTRVYFGGAADEPMPGDYDGDGTSSPAIFRPSTGLWAVKGVTRIYFGSADDEALGAGPVKDPLKVINDSTAAQAAGYYAAFNLQSVQPDLDSANIRSGVTIFGVDGDPNVVDTSSGDAIALQIMAGRVAWVDGSEITGVLPTRTINSAQPDQQGGVYSAFNLQSEDEDLAAENIKKDEVVYGVVGTYNGPGLLWTGQTETYRTGDDGYYQDGAVFSYQTLDPAANGEIVTVDNVTSLMWAADGSEAGCNFGNQTDWEAAVDWAQGLTFAEYTDWRLPNVKELQSIVDYGNHYPTIDTMYFINTKTDRYWSSTTYIAITSSAWYVCFDSCFVLIINKTNDYYVRAVRGGE